MSKEGNEYHKLYIGRSPEYTRTVSRHGRKLVPSVVESILEAHGFTPRDLLDDESDNIVEGTELPDTLDAALLYAWLGY